MRQMLLALAAIFATLLGAVGWAHATGSPTPTVQLLDSTPLKALPPVCVIVDVDKTAADFGISQGDLQTHVELRLREAGIAMAGSPEFTSPDFIISISSLKDNTDGSLII